jgi:tetratricopeptide (TPR) repeat protein
VRAPRALRLAALTVVLATASPAVAQGLGDEPALALYREAAEAMQQQEFARAAELAKRAIAEYPGHLLAHHLLGQAMAAQSRWEEAAAAFARAVELYPRSAALRVDQGSALERLGRVDDAVRAYESALAIREVELVRARVALLLASAGQKDRARPMLEALARADTKLPEVWLALGREAYERGDLGASEKAFARAAALQDAGRTWLNLGVVRARRGDTRAALDAFRRAAAHAETKAQAEAEIDRLRETAIRGPSVPAASPPRPAPRDPTAPARPQP